MVSRQAHPACNYPELDSQFEPVSPFSATVNIEDLMEVMNKLLQKPRQKDYFIWLINAI